MGNDRINNEENYEGRKQEQKSPGRNPQDEQTAQRKEGPKSDSERKFEKDSEHRERGAGSEM